MQNGTIHLLQVARLTEKAPGQYEGVIVAQGKSLNPAFFTEDAINSGVGVFIGAKMFKNHPSMSESFDRPERNIEDIVGEVRSTEVRTLEDGKKAVYGVFYISEAETAIRQKIAEGLITDLSINAHAQATFDQDQGFWIVEKFSDPNTEGIMPPTVDIVTWGAARGSIATKQSFRMAVGNDPTPEPITQDKELKDVNPPIITDPQESPLEDRFNRAMETQSTLLELQQRLTGLPQVTQTRVLSQAREIVAHYVYNGGATIAELYVNLSKLIEDEKTYLEQVAPSGTPRMASSLQSSVSATDPRLVQSIESAYEDLFKL